MVSPTRSLDLERRDVVAPRLPALRIATGAPRLAASRTSRNALNVLTEDPTTSTASAPALASAALACVAAGTPSPKNTTAGLSGPPRHDAHAGTENAAASPRPSPRRRRGAAGARARGGVL